MKYKAILLCLLLAIPVGLIAMPHQAAKASIVFTPFLFVFPEMTNITGPCQVGKTFTVSVWLLSIDMMAESDLFAFDFTLDWSTIIDADNMPIIGLVNGSIAVHSPWPAGGYFTIKNETSLWAPAHTDGYPYSDYHLSMTAFPPMGTGLWDVNQSVVTLTFVVLQDACWPNAYGFDGTATGFILQNVTMSGDGTGPIKLTDRHENGAFYQTPFQPNIDLTSTAANSTGWIIEKCNSHTFDVEVDLTNITDVYGFSFTLKWCPCELETDPQKVTFEAAFPPPYDTSQVTVGSGYLTVTLTRPCEKPTVCGAVVPAVDIVFHTNDTFDGAGVIPTARTSSINITCAAVYAKCPCNTEYDYAGCGNGLLLYGGPLSYYFKPSPYDLNLDCVVDVQDLKMLVPYYGKTTCPGGYGDLFNDGAHLVDVYDFVAMAKHAGPVDP